MSSVEKKKILMSTVALIFFVIVQGFFQNFVAYKGPMTSSSQSVKSIGLN